MYHIILLTIVNELLYYKSLNKLNKERLSGSLFSYSQLASCLSKTDNELYYCTKSIIMQCSYLVTM